VVRVKGSPGASIPLATVAVLSNPLRYAFDEASKAATQFAVGGGSGPPVADGEEPGLEGTGYYSPTQATFANGMHVAIVETDPETAEIHVLRYCVVHDCGPLINPMIVEGQVHGGVAQGVGGALYERMAYDESGQLLNASFMDFLMPYASEVPHIEIDHLETPSPLNPLGIKGAGEAGVIPSAAVFAAAIEDAEGFPVHRMPISPTELFDLRRRHAAGEIPSLHRRTTGDHDMGDDR
jgi:carbon-monoxide dehydrogenase large subunit